MQRQVIVRAKRPAGIMNEEMLMFVLWSSFCLPATPIRFVAEHGNEQGLAQDPDG
jgi:hypothetical protein